MYFLFSSKNQNAQTNNTDLLSEFLSQELIWVYIICHNVFCQYWTALNKHAWFVVKLSLLHEQMFFPRRNENSIDENITSFTLFCYLTKTVTNNRTSVWGLSYSQQKIWLNVRMSPLHTGTKYPIADVYVNLLLLF